MDLTCHEQLMKRLRASDSEANLDGPIVTESKYYVIGEGQKTWHQTDGSSYLPSFECVDKINHPALQTITAGVCKVLADRGLVRVHAVDLSPLLARDIAVPTILADRPWHLFDALFYWED